MAIVIVIIIIITLSYASEKANHSQELMINVLVIGKPLPKPICNPIFLSYRIPIPRVLKTKMI